MTPTPRFEKTPLCPTNEQLLAYQRQELNPADAGLVTAHVADCEFCFLLLDLLAHHPPGKVLPPDPPPLANRLRHLFSHRRLIE
jgi:hypothetical protein